MATNTISEVKAYIQELEKRYKTGISREHSYRGDLQNLLGDILPNLLVTNEPARVSCGAPDYILTKGEIPVGYIEAKDMGADLKSKSYKEQFDRYKASLPNLIITNYLDFHFFKDGELVTTSSIGILDGNRISVQDHEIERFVNLIQDFGTFVGTTIKSASKLSGMMAGKARLMKEVFKNALEEDEADHLNSKTGLQQQYHAFKDILIHDITPEGFADIYAQTIAYGMFAARLHDATLENFSRQEAAELIPKSNPFLRKLFQYIAGYDLDERVAWIVDALADIFRATNVADILKDFGKATQMNDPIIHFYENFLAEYDPKLRKARGVWYTPEPVVNFIVRAVDEILKDDFGLKDGLADTTKTTIEVDTDVADKRSKTGYKRVQKEVHKVQILDPATGTGTFLSEVISHIYKKFKGQEGIWSQYVDDHLIPRLNGFEILMASYAMAHLKLDLLLRETGYKPSKNEQRFKIFLTNSLEEFHPDTGTLFANWLSTEANEANYVKRDTPVMVVIGNPPYSGHSSNKGEWIEQLIQDYFREPDGSKLKEQNSKWLNDDYVKFIRYAEYFIEKNGEGVLAFITNNGYLDNPTFRGMRYHLLQTFTKIYAIDLHGSSKKKEVDSEGNPDKNVFDIQQGVSIILAVKKKVSSKECRVYSADLLGSRNYKYDTLANNGVKTLETKDFSPFAPNYLFKFVDQDQYIKYNHGFNVVNLFPVKVMGFQTHRDNFAISWSREEMIDRATDLLSEMSDDEIYEKYGIKDNRDWQLAPARQKIRSDKDWDKSIIPVAYRPFDDRPSYFSDIMMDYPRKELIQHVANKDNLLLGVGRQGIAVGDIPWCLAMVSDKPVDANFFRRGGVTLAPLYLYQNGSLIESEREYNFNQEIIKQLEQSTKAKLDEDFSGVDLLDYIYAVLHSTNYRKKNHEFLKIEYPRIPYPTSLNAFKIMAEQGTKLREIHMLQSESLVSIETTYPKQGNNVVERKITKTSPGFILEDEGLGKVWINDDQYFDGVPKVAWDFIIGGYEPAQKWLKDRQGKQLSIDEIMHYQKIIKALVETDRIMKEIDKVDFM